MTRPCFLTIFTVRTHPSGGTQTSIAFLSKSWLTSSAIFAGITSAGYLGEEVTDWNYFSLRTRPCWRFRRPCKRGVKGLLRATWLSVFNFRERWKYEIKTRELWLVCLSWYVNFNLLPDIRDFQLIFSWNSFNWRQILQGRQWIFKWTFKKNSKAGYLTSFSQWLTKPCSEPFSIFSTRLS